MLGSVVLGRLALVVFSVETGDISGLMVVGRVTVKLVGTTDWLVVKLENCSVSPEAGVVVDTEGRSTQPSGVVIGTQSSLSGTWNKVLIFTVHKY